MPRKCTICSNHQRTEIESDIRQGTSFRNIIEQYENLSLGGISRHTNNCMVLDLQAALELQKRETATDWYEELGRLYGKVNEAKAQAWDLFRESEDFEDKIKALKAANKWTGTATTIIEKGLKVTGAYKKGKENPIRLQLMAQALLRAVDRCLQEDPNQDRKMLMTRMAEIAVRIEDE